MAQVVEGIVRIGDTSPELKPICEVERNGQKVILRGYVDGRRCPVEVKAAVQGVWVQLAQNTSNDVPVASGLANRDFLFAVIDGIEYSEASMIASDDEATTEIMIGLGWWERLDKDKPPEEPGEMPTGNQSITETSSQDSMPLTGPGIGGN